MCFRIKLYVWVFRAPDCGMVVNHLCWVIVKLRRLSTSEIDSNNKLFKFIKASYDVLCHICVSRAAWLVIKNENVVQVKIINGYDLSRGP